MNGIEERIQEGKLIVDEGRLLSLQQGGQFAPIGHPGNKRGNLVVKYSTEDGKIRHLQATRVAWRIHHGQWPPDDMSVVLVNRNRGDYRRENLMLVPSGKENTALHTLKQMESDANPLVGVR